MELILAMMIIFASGLVIGFEWGDKRKRKPVETPIPDYDVNNPINGKGHRGEIVNVCGADMVRMN